MPEYNEAELKAALARNAGGVYILFGEEDYLIKYYRTKFITTYTDGSAGAYNFISINYESEDDAADIVNAAMSLPMLQSMMQNDAESGGNMSEKKLIEVTVGDMNALKADDISALTDALSDAAAYEESTVIICLYSGSFDYGNLPKRPSALYKKLAATEGISLVYLPYSTPAQLRKWVERHIIHAGLKFDYNTAGAMVDTVGKKMTALSLELEKVTAYVRAHGRDSVSAADIKEVCCAGSEPDAFGLSNAILDGRREDAMAALYDRINEREEPLLILGGISGVMTDMLAVKSLSECGASPQKISSALGMHEYTVKLYMKSVSGRTMQSLEDAVYSCACADTQLKSTRLGYIVLQRLIVSAGRNTANNLSKTGNNRNRSGII